MFRYQTNDDLLELFIRIVLPFIRCLIVAGNRKIKVTHHFWNLVQPTNPGSPDLVDSKRSSTEVVLKLAVYKSEVSASLNAASLTEEYFH